MKNWLMEKKLLAPFLRATPPVQEVIKGPGFLGQYGLQLVLHRKLVFQLERLSLMLVDAVGVVLLLLLTMYLYGSLRFGKQMGGADRRGDHSLARELRASGILHQAGMRLG